MAHKRRKTSGHKHDLVPLGTPSCVDGTDKDDEERRLESMLFGVPYVGPQDDPQGVISDVQDETTTRDLRELENMLDSDLFFIDDHAGSASIKAPASDDVSDKSDSDACMVVEGESLPHEQAHTEHVLSTPGPETRKAPAWVDPDDSNIQVSLASHTRLRKLRDAPGEDAVGGREYERRLRRQYEHINPTPEWASKARKKLHSKRPRAASGSDPGDDITTDLLASTGGISGGKKPKVLSQGIISVDRLRDANQAAPAEGEIKSVQFHPSTEIPVLLTASTDRRLRLFHVDGLTNPHRRTLHIPSLPITNAVFHPTGASILLTGPRPFYYTYDLQSGTSHRSPRGLWGTTFGANDQPQQGGMDLCAFNPTGDVLAIAGRRGHIHLVDWRSGSAQVVAGLKANAGIRSLWWSRSGDGPSTLLSLTEGAQVYVWDVGQRRCVKRWQDEGGFGSRIIGGDPRGKHLAIGSNTGLVNVYSAESAVSSTTANPKPLKTLGNLTTNISCLRYNHDAQLLAMASNLKKDQMRLVHHPSLTAFANWPTSSTPLGHVTAMDFSTGSEYLAIGNNRGRVLLYQLRDYRE